MIHGRKLAALTALALGLAGCGREPAHAPAPVPRPTPTEVDGATTGPLLWRVEGLAHPLWLFGTMHFMEASAVHPAVRRALGESSVLCAELDPTSVDPAAAAAAMMLPPDQTLDGQLSAGAWTKLVEYLGATYPEAALKRMTPASVALMLSMKARNAPPPKEPVDVGLWTDAKRSGKKTVAFETFEQQMAMMNRNIVATDLETMLADVAKVERDTKALEEAYAAGRDDGLDRLVAGSVATRPETLEAIIYARNDAWMRELPKTCVGDGGGLVAVGAAHLVGARGLVAQLRKRGLRVVRVHGREP